MTCAEAMQYLLSKPPGEAFVYRKSKSSLWQRLRRNKTAVGLIVSDDDEYALATYSRDDDVWRHRGKYTLGPRAVMAVDWEIAE